MANNFSVQISFSNAVIFDVAEKQTMLTFLIDEMTQALCVVEHGLFK